MPLAAEEIAALVGELAPLVDGAAVESVHQRDEHTVILTFYSPRSGKLHLLLSTRPQLIRFHLVEEKPASLPEPPAFCEIARKLLKGSRVTGVRQVSGDRVVELAFSRRGEGEHRETAFLVLELMGGRGQLAIVGEGRSLLASLHPFRRGSKQVALGDAYRFPAPRAQPPQLQAMGKSPWRYLEESADESSASRAAAPLHFAFARRYFRLEETEILREKKEVLSALLRRETAAKEELVRKVRDDLARAEAGDEHRQKGELLKGAFGRIRRGMSSIELENYFDPDIGNIRIDLEPALGPQQNIERYFKRFQKCRRGVPVLRERLARLEAERQRAADLLSRLEACDTLDAVTEIEAQAKPLRAKRHATRKKGPAVTAALGPRRFVSRDGFEILVGRSAKQNDELTLRLARGNDVFLHVAGSPGSHVIVRSVPGKQAPLETLLDAAQLALYYSLPDRQRGAAGSGAAADVDYTPVKHVRKPRGAKPGLVLLATHKSLRVRLEAERLERLKRSTTGEGEAREN